MNRSLSGSGDGPAKNPYSMGERDCRQGVWAYQPQARARAAPCPRSRFGLVRAEKTDRAEGSAGVGTIRQCKGASARGAVMHSSERVWRERGLRAAVLAGDERAWRAWYDECFPGLYAYVSWRCAGLRDLADEVVQDTWLIAVRRMRRFDPEQGSFRAWLHGIAANV